MNVLNVPYKIAMERIARGWSEYELAKRADIPQTTISSWCRKNQLPSLVSLSKVCDAFGVTVSQFLSDDGLTEVLPEEEELLNLFRRLSEEKRKALLVLLSPDSPK